LLSKKLRFRNFEDSLRKWAEILAHENPESFYQGLVSHWKNPDQIVLASEEPKARFGELDSLPNLPSFRECMMYIDQVTYLPDDILAKVDRASMAVSLEARVPMLDHRLVEFAWNLPMEFKYRAGQQKWLLRQVLYRYVPRELVDRPKMGFGVPIEHWLRGPLREWADDLLNEKRIREQGFFDPKPIRKLWSEHVSGQRRWHYRLWDVLMFQAWLAQKK
jgi:asparagine synthase (glutamine-hydrolysing)